jgi:single-strand DNA-binding protein
MFGFINEVTLLGNLGRDPEIRSTQTGDRITSLAIATSESWTDKRSGERKERTEWHRVVVFRDGLAPVIEKWAHKGSKVMVRGKLVTRKWTDNDGVERYTTEITVGQFNGEIQFLDAKKDGGPGTKAAGRTGGEAAADESSGDTPRSSDLDDEIPY